MDDFWRPRSNPPRNLVRPVPTDPAGLAGPTPGQAKGPYWRRSTPRLYVPSNAPESVEQRILEQSMRLPVGGAVTGWAALRLAGGGFFSGLADDGRTLLDVPLVLPPGRDLRRAAGFTVSRERVPPREVKELHGIRCTTPARATFDEVRRAAGLRAAVVVVDMALAAGVVTFGELEGQLASRAGSPGSALFRAALPLSDRGSRSPQESRLRLIWMLDAGYPKPLCNPGVGDESGSWLGRPDLLSVELGVVGEYDGAFHRDRDRHRADVRRDDLFRRHGLEMFTVVGGDLGNIAFVVDRMRSAVQRAQESRRPWTWTVKR